MNFFKRIVHFCQGLNIKRNIDQKATRVQQELAVKIGYFYLEKNKGDYEKTYKEIRELEISKISKHKNIILITLGRPGLLVGCHGKNIKNLQDYLKKEYSKTDLNVVIHVKEDKVLNWLYPVDFTNDYEEL
jgi:ribosomal protein S3